MLHIIRHSFSKTKFPTRLTGSSTSKSLIFGQDLAERELRQRVARRLGPLTRKHTRTRWIFDEAIVDQEPSTAKKS